MWDKLVKFFKEHNEEIPTTLKALVEALEGFNEYQKRSHEQYAENVRISYDNLLKEDGLTHSESIELLKIMYKN